MNRRQLLGLAGGTAVSTIIMGEIAPPAQAFFPLWLRALIFLSRLRKKPKNPKKLKPVKQLKRSKRGVRRRRQNTSKV